MLKFSLSEIPEKKKGAIGVQGIKLAKGDAVVQVYVFEHGEHPEIEIGGVKVALQKLKMKKRAQTGQKVRETGRA